MQKFKTDINRDRWEYVKKNFANLLKKNIKMDII